MAVVMKTGLKCISAHISPAAPPSMPSTAKTKETIRAQFFRFHRPQPMSPEIAAPMNAKIASTTPSPAIMPAPPEPMLAARASAAAKKPMPRIISSPAQMAKKTPMKCRIAKMVTPSGRSIEHLAKLVLGTRQTGRRADIYTLNNTVSATLKEILASVRERVQQARRSADLGELRQQAAQYQPRGFRAALERAALERTTGRGPAIIAELKKTSPSKGVIRRTFPVAQLARELEAAGAAALSVLTEEKYFQGSLANLGEASAATRLPCLRKDFILDEFQLLEARAHGADAVLLIVAALEEKQLRHLAAAALELRLDVLCEVHDEGELQQALTAGCDVIGVNS